MAKKIEKETDDRNYACGYFGGYEIPLDDALIKMLEKTGLKFANKELDPKEIELPEEKREV